MKKSLAVWPDRDLENISEVNLLEQDPSGTYDVCII